MRHSGLESACFCYRRPQAFLYIVYSRSQHVSLVTLVTCSDSSALHAISGLWSAFVDAARILLFYHLTFFCVHTKLVRTRVLLNTYSIAPCIPLFNRSLHSAIQSLLAFRRTALRALRKVLVVVLFLAQSSLASWSLLASHVLRQVFTSS